MNDKCRKCGSDRIIPLVPVQDTGQYASGRLQAHVGFTNPEAWLFKGAVNAKLSATICGECGSTELTAENPAELYEAYIATKSHSG